MLFNLEPKCYRLTPKNASLLAFLYFNLPEFNFGCEWPQAVQDDATATDAVTAEVFSDSEDSELISNE
jgi:hypothetical protein